jgi:transcriptional regulator with XRE-family HTH domain
MKTASLLIKDEKTLMQTLESERKRLRVTQEALAERMQTKHTALSRMKRGITNHRIATYQKYAEALGMSIEFRLVPAGK